VTVASRQPQGCRLVLFKTPHSPLAQGDALALPLNSGGILSPDWISYHEKNNSRILSLSPNPAYRFDGTANDSGRASNLCPIYRVDPKVYLDRGNGPF
jgi:hypothetical protein